MPTLRAILAVAWLAAITAVALPILYLVVRAWRRHESANPSRGEHA